ncbi:uncharacterized protein [Typha angustifolia]|uniref:uncharacterized protein n=1 Tax=Typha angustifolia TaxID=59011 RepID=UPI003C2AFDB8
MSRIPKWKVEKTKVKVVFRLQFHATHIPQTGWDKLFVSFIPADTGKSIINKTNKANVRNGSCKWSDPIYETTRLLQDTRTKKYDEKIYKLVVAMGSSRASFLGEVDINLADFADALKPSSVELPLHGCDFGTILHVTVQILTSKVGFREFEQQRELSVKGFQMIPNKKCHDPPEISARSSDITGEQRDKVNARLKFKGNLMDIPSVEEMSGSIEDYEDSAAGVDCSSYTSDSLYAEKNEISGAHEIESFKGTISDYVGGFSLSQSPRPEKEGYRGSSLSNLGSNDWMQGWSSDYSADNDLATAYEENNRLRVRLEVAESAFLQLKSEAKSLQRITDELGAETQTLAQQLAVELTSGEQLVREVSMLKSECSNLKIDLEMLKSAKGTQQIPDRRTLMMKSEAADTSFGSELGNDVLVASHPTDHLEVKWLQELLLIESKVHEIQNKVCDGLRGRDFDFLHSDFEVLECALNNVKQGIDQSHCLEQTVSDHQYMEGRIACITGSHQLYHGHDPLKTNIGAANMTEEKICEILQKLEESKTEKEILIKKLDHMECYYEAFIHDLEESQKQTVKEMESLRNEHSSSLYKISVLQAQIEKVRQEMDEQLMRFVKERNAFESQKKELEKRATASEAALQRVRRNYSIAVNRLEKDLELLSFQVLSMYETNETLAKQDFTDAYHICPEEDSEDAQLYSSKDDPLRLFYQKDTYKPDDDQIQSESLCSKTDSELSLKYSSLSESSSNKSTTKVCQVVAAKNKELHSRNETYDNTNNPTNFLRADSQHINISMKNLVFSADLPTHTERNELLPERSAVNFEIDSQPLGCAQEDKQRSNDANDIEEMKMSLHNLLVLRSSMEDELSDMHVVTIQQEVFSRVLLETLHNVNDEIKHMNNRIIELEQQVDHSNDVRESLVLKFHSALDQAKILREAEAKYIVKYDELTSKNQILEDKLHDVSVENALLTEKFAEYENLMVENKAYESKYKASIEERNKLENLLVQENLQKCHLQSDIGSMLEDFNALKEEFDRKSSVNDDLQKAITSLQGGLCDLFSDMIFCNRQINNSAFDDVYIQQEFESKNYIAILTHLKQFHEQACQKILKLHQEKDEMEVMRDTAESALKMSDSKIAEYEKLIMEYRACESKYKACIEERDKLENLLIEENLQKGHLQNEIVLMIEDLHALKEESLKKSSMGDDLQRAVTSLQGGLHDLCSNMILYSRQINDLGFDELSLKKELEGKNYMAIIACLENFQKQAYQKILQLHQEKEKMETMKDTVYSSLKMTESKMFDMKKKLECGLEDVETKFITKYVDLASKNQILEEKFQDVSVENASLTEKFAEYEKLILEYKDYESKYKASTEERNKLENLLLQENRHKQSEIGSLIEDLDALKEELDKKSCVIVDLEKTVTSLQGGLSDLCCNMISCNRQISSLASDDVFLNHEPESKNFMAIVTHLEQFQEQTCQKVLQLHRDKKEMEVMKDMAQSSLKNTESMMLNMKQKLESDLESKTTKLDLSNKLIGKLQQELLEVTEKFKIILEAEENHAKENGELSSKLASLEVELQNVTEESRDLVQKLKISDSVNEEHERIKINLMDCKQENRTLMMSIQSRNEVSMQLENELRNSKETLRLTHENLQIEKGLREELESALTNLTLQLKEKDHQLLSFNEEKAELVHLREKILSLEKENMEMQHLLLQNEEIQKKLDAHNSSMRLQICDVENHLAPILEDWLVADIEVSSMRSQVQELFSQLKASREDLEELHLKYMDAVALLVPNGAELVDRNATWLTVLQSTKLEAEEVTHYKEGHVDCIKRNGATWTEPEDTKDEAVQAETSKENQTYEDEVLRLKDTLIVLEEQVDDLRSFREELEITNIVLRSKLDEQQSYITLLKVSENELTNLRQQHNELTHKLSEQILKTEEFKNLSIHLRELKNKEDAENLQARERRQNDGQRFIRQDSLRVAFIKEQYESKIQDLRTQLQASKTYAEEMLLKLQHALDEVESGKKNEVCLAKRIEELSMEIADMKTELHTIVTDRRELGKAYDSIKTELECSVLSFNCCKEEKLKLEASLKECNEERNKISVELDLVKRLLENMVSTENIQFQGDNGLCISEVTSIEQLLGDGNSLFADVVKDMPNIRGIYCGKGPAIDIDGDNLPNKSFSSSACGEREDIERVSVQEHAFLSSLSTSQSSEDSQNRTGRETCMENDRKYDATAEEHFKEQQRLKIGMNLLLKELERLKNENLSSLLSLEDDLHDPSLNDLERSLSQLDMANEHLGNIFPSFKELPDSSGNALERVLALELELAEALQTKKKTDIRFQSSFLKQHNDEEAVFQSFRDINELIQDMLELKKRHVTVESELKEMQARYSQLSLQFAEVEGERQKLMMTLKNRASRKT